MSKQEWTDYISRISYMFQNNALFDSMTVFENVALPLERTTKLSRKEIERTTRIEQASCGRSPTSTPRKSRVACRNARRWPGPW
jgi:phospholipid/cholesterol/gamma-HCH transport system ATP-binding protein